jgi:prophage regulatory protein
MTYRLLSLRAVSAARRDEPKATTYLRIKQGLLTPPLKMCRSSAWPENEIEAINAAIIAGKSEDEIRALVRELIAARTTAQGDVS